MPFCMGCLFTKIFLSWFSAVVDYHFLTENYFLLCVLSFILTVYEEASTRNKEECIIFEGAPV